MGTLCGPGITVCGVVTTGIGTAIGIGYSRISPQTKYLNELKKVTGMIDAWIAKISLSDELPEHPFALYFNDGVNAEDGYFSQVYIDGEWIDVSYDVYKTLVETFSDPTVKEDGNYFEFEGSNRRANTAEDRENNLE